MQQTILSLSLSVVVCSLLLGYTFIISPVHGWEKLNNELMRESEKDTRLNRAEIQSLKALMALMKESTRDDLAHIMARKRTRRPGKEPKEKPSTPQEPPSSPNIPHNANGLCKCSKCKGNPSNPSDGSSPGGGGGSSSTSPGGGGGGTSPGGVGGGGTSPGGGGGGTSPGGGGGGGTSPGGGGGGTSPGGGGGGGGGSSSSSPGGGGGGGSSSSSPGGGGGGTLPGGGGGGGGGSSSSSPGGRGGGNSSGPSRPSVEKPFDNRLECINPNPLAQYTSGVPKGLEDVANRFKNINPDCGGDRNIKLIDIMKLANSITGKELFPIDADHSYSYLPTSMAGCKRRFYESGKEICNNGVACERNFRDSEMYLISDCPKVKEYWSGWTPCFFCQKSLLKWKEQTRPNEAIKIHVGLMYNWGDKPTKTACLALMIKKGFVLENWNWQTFENQMMFGKTEEFNECRLLIRFLQLCQELNTARRKMEINLKNAQKMAMDKREAVLKKDCML